MNAQNFQILNDLSAHIAVLDRYGFIVYSNLAWQKFASDNNMPVSTNCIGINYLEVCDNVVGIDETDAITVSKGIKQVLNGLKSHFEYEYFCKTPTKDLWFYLRVAKLQIKGAAPFVIIAHENITPLKEAHHVIEEKHKKIEEKAKELEESYVTIKTLLNIREKELAEIKYNIASNIHNLILPQIEQMRTLKLGFTAESILANMEKDLQNVFSSFLSNLTHDADMRLSITEKRIASLVSDGKTSKEISSLLGMPKATVDFYRKKLRKHFNLPKNGKTLRNHLKNIAPMGTAIDGGDVAKENIEKIK